MPKSPKPTCNESFTSLAPILAISCHPPKLSTPISGPQADLPGVLHSLQAAQHVLEMFRRSLPDGGDRRILDRLMNRFTKILSRVRKLAPSQK